MARKDEILQSFLEHELIKSKYGIDEEQLPDTLRAGLQSEYPIIKAISLIVDGMESLPQVTDSALRNTITQYLDKAAI